MCAGAEVSSLPGVSHLHSPSKNSLAPTLSHVSTGSWALVHCCIPRGCSVSLTVTSAGLGILLQPVCVGVCVCLCVCFGSASFSTVA